MMRRGSPPAGARRRRDGRRFFPRRKVCGFCVEHIKDIDYKDVPRLRRYISTHATIEPRRKTGTCAPHQRALSMAIKRARYVALLPFTGDHSLIEIGPPDRGRGDRSRYGDRRGRPEGREAAPGLESARLAGSAAEAARASAAESAAGNALSEAPVVEEQPQAVPVAAEAIVAETEAIVEAPAAESEAGDAHSEAPVVEEQPQAVPEAIVEAPAAESAAGDAPSEAAADGEQPQAGAETPDSTASETASPSEEAPKEGRDTPS